KPPCATDGWIACPISPNPTGPRGRSHTVRGFRRRNTSSSMKRPAGARAIRKTPATKWESEQLHDYVLFMANTGLRPDEANRLEYRDVKIVEDDASNETILEIEVRGKRGVGYCKSTSGAVRPFQRLVERNKPQPTDAVFPSVHRELFNTILDEESL